MKHRLRLGIQSSSTMPFFMLILLLSTCDITPTNGLTPTQSSSLATSKAPSPRLQTPLSATDSRQEAQVFQDKARQLRQEISESSSLSSKDDTKKTKNRTTVAVIKRSEWSVEPSRGPTSSSMIYRLYIDIGREDGSWMHPRWGASGRRLEGTLDVCFSSIPASKEVQDGMVEDNQIGKSSDVMMVETATKARFKGGFDGVKVQPGGYRLDNGGTIRFYVSVEGTENGDVSLPQGNLYFSLPCFRTRSGEGIILSATNGLCSVRQVGWNTGWRRQESRIVGVFRAVPIHKAQLADGY
eukprot:scaffold321_cov95-Cylindrotheca_fusiformis.AAC.4